MLYHQIGRILDSVTKLLEFSADFESQVFLDLVNDKSRKDFDSCLIYCSYGDFIDYKLIEQIEDNFPNTYFLLCVNKGRGSGNIKNKNRFHRIIVRKNRGRDLAGYRDAINLVLSEGLTFKKFILINNSVVWNTENAINIYEKLLESTADYTGVTSSYQKYFHIQSFAICIDGTKIRRFLSLSQWRNWRIKRNIVALGEVSLTRRLLENDFSVEALFDGRQIQFAALGRKRVRKHFSLMPQDKNPSKIISQEKLEQYGFAKIKY